jgi:hypothetical protein
MYEHPDPIEPWSATTSVGLAALDRTLQDAVRR